MLSPSPQPAASSPGPTSSQSSTSGSHYSSSLASSRYPTSSAASSGQTSPPTAGDPLSPSAKGVHHADRQQNGMIHNYSTSPENNREQPLAKTRRTSPGGSRASGELYPTRSTPGSGSLAAQAMTSAGSSHGSHWQSATSSPGRVNSGSSSTFQGNWHTGSGQFQAPSSQSSSQTAINAAGGLSPRTRASDARGKSPVSSALGSFSSSAGMTSETSRSRREPSPAIKTPPLPKMNLATFPPQDLLKVLATLLHEIATANDEFRPESGKDDAGRRKKSSRSKDKERSQGEDPEAEEAAKQHPYTQASHLSFNDSRRPSITTAALGALATPSSTLCFHARNVPSISIESYLLRILKYCPTTNEVFLSLLVYFDRMSRMGIGAKPGANGDGEIAGEAAGLPRAAEMANMTGSSGSSSKDLTAEPFFTHPGIRGFAIDSYNVHRLVIAGVTVASKFFSDVFYTNSRYAKVGGLPVHELNQLELQFLLLNDFRLTIPLEEMQRYADQLLMYGSGRPENVGMVKELGSIHADPGNPVGLATSVAPDREGDVRMRDA